MNFYAIIPARYQSTRFPGKPLCQLEGMSMIERVYRQVSKIERLSGIFVATDDTRIADHVHGFTSKVLMTSPNHRSGTDRCAEVLAIVSSIQPDDVVINVQGDEPFINPQQIEELMSCFENADTNIATLAKIITQERDLHNPNIVKVVINSLGKALYFSRYAIPYLRTIPFEEHVFYKHIGIYAYKANVLKKLVALPLSKLEQAESLEQLRWLDAGYPIDVKISNYAGGMGIDTPEDLQAAILYLNQNRTI